MSANTYDPGTANNTATVTTPVAAGRPTDPGPPLGELLQRLVRLGLLVSEDELVSIAERAPAGGEKTARVSTLGVVTRDRPESLRRCLESYIENVRRHGREVSFAVMDGAEQVQDGQGGAEEEE